jgi:gag-polypeptide of LTR copia-type
VFVGDLSMDVCGISINAPPVLDGTNYPWWKTAMRTFLLSHDFLSWVCVENGYQPPFAMEREIVDLKRLSDYSYEEMLAAKHNFTGLNAIFRAVRPHLRIYVNSCSTSKEAWDALEVMFEGNPNEKVVRLQNLSLKWEDLSMAEDDPFNEFYHKLSDVVLASHSMGKTIPEKEIVMKILRSLPSRYDTLRHDIEEGNNLDHLSQYSLIERLSTFDCKDLSREVPSRSHNHNSTVAATSCCSILTRQNSENCFALILQKFKTLFRCDKRKSHTLLSKSSSVCQCGETCHSYGQDYSNPTLGWRPCA